MKLEENVLTIGLDADHALNIERAPCSIACFCLAEIPAADDIGFCRGRASPFDFLAVTRIELDGTKAAVKLDESNADDAAASVGDELLNESGFVHGFGRVVGFSAREGNIPANGMEKGPCGPVVTFRNNQALPLSIRDAFAFSLDRFCHSLPFIGHKALAASL